MTVEVVTRVERRRRWRLEDKARLVEETLAPGASVAKVALRNGVAQSVLFAWRRQAREGQLGAKPSAAVLMPVAIADPVVPEAKPAPSASGSRIGVIEIELGGGLVVRVGRDVDADALRRVLGVLERRR